MAFLRVLSAVLCLQLVVGCTGSEVSTTKIDYLETDTYIRSANLSPNSDSTELVVLKNEGDESRILIKLPTEAEEDVTEDILNNPAATFILFPWVITVAVLSTLFGCSNNIVTADNLTSAKLVFDIVNSEESTLESKLSLNLLSKPWWQSANWTAAHPFSSEGVWTQRGGDFDDSFSTVASTQGSGTVEFEVTDYFRTLISNQKTEHFGLVVSSAGVSLGETKLKSVQSSQSTSRPRVVSNYTGPCTSASSTGSRNVYYLPQNSIYSESED